MKKYETVSQLIEARAVAILRGLQPDQIAPTIEALLDGGISALEITLNSPGALEQIKIAASVAAGRAVIGAGTVLDEAAACAAILSGADFLVAPNLNPAVIQAAHRYGKVAVPGALSPTEIQAAAEAGADIIKVFPARTVGPVYFREVKAPLSHVVLMATGGISIENAREYIEAGADLVGMGSALVDTSLVANGNFSELSARAKSLLTTLG